MILYGVWAIARWGKTLQTHIAKIDNIYFEKEMVSTFG
jgi:hypothetical protein